jgi:hypothetical protein
MRVLHPRGLTEMAPPSRTQRPQWQVRVTKPTKTLSKKIILITMNANMHSLQVRTYRHEAGWLWRARRSPGIHPGVLHLVDTNRDCRLMMEEVTK